VTQGGGAPSRGQRAAKSTAGSDQESAKTVPQYPYGGDPVRRARLWRAREDELQIQRAARKLDALLAEMYGEVG
jgi:hypothetical protein